MYYLVMKVEDRIESQIWMDGWVFLVPYQNTKVDPKSAILSISQI